MEFYSAYFFPSVMYIIIYSEYMYPLLVHQTVMESIFLIQMEYRLQSMYDHMVERAGSIPSPLNSILLAFYPMMGISDSQHYSIKLESNQFSKRKTKYLIYFCSSTVLYGTIVNPAHNPCSIKSIANLTIVLSGNSSKVGYYLPTRVG